MDCACQMPELTPGGSLYRRVVLKLSGEAIGGASGRGFDGDALEAICREVALALALEVQIGIVVGGGNFFRGAQSENLTMDRMHADYIGMLATVMNAIALQQALQAMDVPARVQAAIPMSPVCEPYVRERALRHLSKNRVVIFAAGTGSPFFTTDTAASLRAIEIEADVLLKATQVDGVYDRDPARFANAKRYQRISYDEVLKDRLQVMDATAIALCREHNVPLQIFDIKKTGCLHRILVGDDNEGTLVHGEAG